MHYKPLTNDKKGNIEMPDAAFQCSPTFQLVELKRTRRILLFLTGIQFVFSLLIIFGIIYAYLFGYIMEVEWLNPIVRSLPILSCVCFLIGSLAADQCHIKGLLIFSKLLTLNLIITYLIVGVYIVIPLCLRTYPANICAKIIFAISYQAIFCIGSFLPGYTIRMAEKLSELLIDNKCPSIK